MQAYREMDEFVLNTVMRAIYTESNRLGCTLAWVYSQESTPGQSIYPGRNFTVWGPNPLGGRAWTVWLDERNTLLDEDALSGEAKRHIQALVASNH